MILGFLVAVIVGIVPMVVYAAILWWFDRYEKEPVPLLVAAFLWGAVPAVIFSFIVEVVLGIPISRFVTPMTADVIGSVLVAPAAEESFKGAALLLLFIFFRHEIDDPLDGIIYGGLVGFGFAAVENVLYFFNEAASSGVGGVLVLAVFRAFLFGLNHALFTGFTGLGLALARTSPNILVRIISPFAGLAAGMTAHGIHNGSVTLGATLCWPCLIAFLSDWGGVLLLLTVMIWASVLEQRRIVTFLADEVERGVLPHAAYETICSYVRRFAARSDALLRGDFKRWWTLGRYYRLATELAFNKHRLTQFPDERDTMERIERLRREVAALSDEVG